MAVLSDFSLSFLDNLPSNFDDDDVEQAWNDRVFPLALTDDFKDNWFAARDNDGQFITPSGKRCRIEPRPHHAPRLQAKVSYNGIPTEQQITYQLIIFAKLAYKESLSKRSDEPFQVARRRFAKLVATKFPVLWRATILQCHLHNYDEHTVKHSPSMTSYLYAPLADTRNIRLLTVLPSLDSHAPIQCILREASHESTAEYEALSYVWGSSSSQRSILLNDQPVPVGENLEAALRQLRPRDGESRTMWVDALCINQGDLGERSQQVAQMDSVYGNATGVVVWLGRESNTSSLVFDLTDRFRREFKFQENTPLPLHFLKFAFEPEPYCAECSGRPRHPLPATVIGTHVSERDANSFRQHIQDPTISSHEWTNSRITAVEDINTLLARPWWRRVWVLQEVILAKRITVLCGPRSADWRILQMVLYTVVRQSRRSLIHHIGGLSHRSREARAHAELLHLVHCTSVFFFMQRSSLYAQRLPPLSMADLLSLTAQFKATDPRDRLFSLISLLPEGSEERVAFKPNYTTDTRGLYINAAKYFVSKMQSLAVVTARPLPPEYLSRATPPSKTELQLPSWVPDWETPQLWQLNSIWLNDFSLFKTMCLYMLAQNQDEQQSEQVSSDSAVEKAEGIQLFNAGLYKTSPFPYKFSDYEEVLRVRGETVDTIEEVGPAWYLGLAALQSHVRGKPHESHRAAHNAQMAIINNWKSVARVSDDGTYLSTNQSRLEAFWRTLFMGRYRSRFSSDGFNIKRFPSGLDEVDQIFKSCRIECRFPPETPDDEARLIWYLRHEVTEMWSFANVNLHCAELKMFRTQKGYIGVCHPRARVGDKVTVLLGAAVPMILRYYPEGHVLIGQSYVHGIMDGEAIQAKHDESKIIEADFEEYKII